MKKKAMAILAAIFLVLALGFGVSVDDEQKTDIRAVVSDLIDSFEPAE